MATSVRLYQRLNTEGFPLIPVPYSRNGSPIADKNATAFYLRYRAGGKRHYIPAGANVLEADAQGKVLEARLLKGVQVITLQPDKADGSDWRSKRKNTSSAVNRNLARPMSDTRTQSNYSSRPTRKPTSTKSPATTNCSTRRNHSGPKSRVFLLWHHGESTHAA
jgi:hypothetical protein